MKRIVIVGKPNVGKTLFVLNFADFLGAKDLTIRFISERAQYQRAFNQVNAHSQLVSDTPHQTRSIQEVAVSIPWGKGKRQFELVDSTGLADGIHVEPQLRWAMAQTLSALKGGDIVVHVIDCQAAYPSELDLQLANFGSTQKKGYVILANKVDLITPNHLRKVIDFFPDRCVIPVSAKYKLGFREVRDYVRRQL